uniref:Uncharacterized protein n=1 Tax=viral metagenome TaxID=1070528 RepID=A0A6M3LUK6_9ZZZZ
METKENKEYSDKEIRQTLKHVRNIIRQKPDLYTLFVSTCAAAWSDFENGYNRKLNGLTQLLWKLIKSKKAKEYLDNRKTQGFLNLDMFPEIEEELKRIASKTNNPKSDD